MLHAYANLECRLNATDKGDGDSVQIQFAGSSETITVNTKDGDVDGSKFGGNMSEPWNGPTYDQATNSYTWTIKVSPKSYATNLKITDTIGSNLTFDAGSFTLVDAQGNPVSGTCSATVDGSKATISLGNLAAGDYYVQYKTTVKSLPSADNTNITDAGNNAEFSWGSKSENKKEWISSQPQETKYSMVSKSADGGSTPDKIKWVVKLNDGSVKADMGGYVFSDTVESDQTFLLDEGVTITDEGGNSITPSITGSDSSLGFTFPDDAGEKQYTVTYYTAMTNTSSREAVSNTAQVTPPDPDHGPKGEGEGSYTPPDTGTYITKALAADVDSASYVGEASWKSEILFGDMAADTDPTSIVFTDKFGSLGDDNRVLVSLNGNVTLEVAGGAKLTEGIDYSIEKAEAAQGVWSELFTITFKDSTTVENLIGSDDAKVIVSYKTKTTQANGEYPTGEYKNVSTVKTDKKSDISAEAKYTIEREATPPAVIKDGTSASWDADYAWSDGSKGAWITDWTVYVNSVSNQNPTAVLDLKGKEVVVADKLPANTEVVKGSATYVLRNGYWPQTGDIAVAPTVSDGVATFNMATAGQKDTQQNPFDYTEVSVKLSYKTATKLSVDSKGTLTNTAEASSGSYEFPAGEGTATYDSKVLSKTGSEITGSSARLYTITVNENAYDLVADSDTLTLVDDLDYRGELSAATISVKAADGTDLLANGKASYTIAKVDSGVAPHTRLTLTVPDSTKMTVTYQVVPTGEKNEVLENFSNTCSLTGLESSGVVSSDSFAIAESSGGTASESWGISIIKHDSTNATKNLEGAVFELWQIDLDASTKESIVKEKLYTKTTDKNGKVSFGDDTNRLESNKLYYYVETKAPDGYEITNKSNTYVMLKSTETQSGYMDALKKAVALGCIPSNGREYNEYDKLANGSFELNIEKIVEGEDAPKNAEFLFTAVRTGTNAAAAPQLSDVTIAAEDGAGTYTGKFTGTLTDAMVGQTFTYNVRELGVAPDGWTYDSGIYTATLVVEAQDGKLVGTVSYAKDGAAADKMTFTNTYEKEEPAPATGEFQLSLLKKVNGGAVRKGETFEFTATATGENDVTAPSFDPVTTDENGKASFAKASLGDDDEGKTYTYVISEKTVFDAPDGCPVTWTGAPDVVATVTVGARDENNKLPVTVKYGDSDTATCAEFNNLCEARATARLSVSKTVVGGTAAVKDKAFSFQLYDVSGMVFNPKPISTLDGVKAGETKEFEKELAYTRPGVYRYCIHEVSDGLAPAWTAGKDVYAEVTVLEKENRSLYVAGIKYGGSATDAAAGFTNTYAPAQVGLKVKKTVNGGALLAGESFGIKLEQVKAAESEDPEEVEYTEVGHVTVDSTTAGGVATIADLEFDTPGTYSYKLSEDPNADEHWMNAEDIDFTVTVEKHDGSLVATLNDPSGRISKGADGTYSASFNNVYSSETKAVLKAHKVIEGATEASKGKEFKFELKDESGQVIDTKTAKGGETVAFAELSYSKLMCGAHTYTISESAADGTTGGWTFQGDVTATVVVGMDAANRLVEVKSIAYTMDGVDGYKAFEEADGTVAARFTNTYAAAGAATVEVHKTVNGGTDAAEGEKFTFALYSTKKSDAGEDVKDQKLDTVEVEAGKTASFSDAELTYAAADAGKTFTYIVSEEGHDSDAWFAAPDVKVEVSVKDNGDGTLTAATAYPSDAEAAEFDDAHSTASATLGVYKTVNAVVNKENASILGGDLIGDEKFTFALLDSEGKQVGDEVTVDKGSQKADFGALTFDKEGTYSYTIRETSEAAGGWTNDDDVAVEITVRRDEKARKLVAEVEYNRQTEVDGASLAWFDNDYEAEVDSGLKVSKAVTGATKAVADETFEFQLVDKDGKVVSTAKAKADETVPFEGVLFKTADAGKTFEYTIREVGHTTKGWTADSDVKATVKVTENEDRALSVEAAYSRGTEAAEFTNAYATSGTAAIGVYKTVNGGTTAKPGEKYTFQLIDKKGKVLDTISTEAGKVASFAKLRISREGTWTYTVHETGHDSNGWTAAPDVTATVSAVDNGDGTLKVTVTYSNGEKAAAFDNKYEEPKTSKPSSDTSSTSGTTPKTGDAATAAFALVAAGGLALVASGLRRRRMGM